eukprot:scaffold1973_cov399-Prasinococcus_capsulatus_cf.AAC.5
MAHGPECFAGIRKQRATHAQRLGLSCPPPPPGVARERHRRRGLRLGRPIPPFASPKRCSPPPPAPPSTASGGGSPRPPSSSGRGRRANHHQPCVVRPPTRRTDQASTHARTTANALATTAPGRREVVAPCPRLCFAFWWGGPVGSALLSGTPVQNYMPQPRVRAVIKASIGWAAARRQTQLFTATLVDTWLAPKGPHATTGLVPDRCRPGIWHPVCT